MKTQLEVLYSNELPNGVRLEFDGKVIIGTKPDIEINVKAI